MYYQQNIKVTTSKNVIHATDSTLLHATDEPILEGVVIVLDPGHGGHDAGSIGLYEGVIEKDLNLQVARNIQEEFQNRTSATVFLTRNSDIALGNNQMESLQNRIEFSQNVSADLFISIHHDAFEDSSVKGITTHYGKEEDEDLARIVHNKIFSSPIQSTDRGYRLSDYYIMKNNTAPTLLLELGYTSNSEDEKYMISENFQNYTTEAIVDGIIEYLLNGK